MKHATQVIVTLTCLFLMGCQQHGKDDALLHRDFFNDTWERFDFVTNTLEIKEETVYDLSLSISFTDAYPNDDFSMVFTVFDSNDNPYRSRGYKFKLKDDEGNWSAEEKDGCHTFELPINKQFRITEPGTYRFQIEYRMPKTPMYGVRALTLYANN